MAIGGAVYYGDSRSRGFVHRSRAVDGGSSSVDSSARSHERAPEIEAERQKNDAARDSGAELSSRELRDAHERQTGGRWRAMAIARASRGRVVDSDLIGNAWRPNWKRSIEKNDAASNSAANSNAWAEFDRSFAFVFLGDRSNEGGVCITPKNLTLPV